LVSLQGFNASHQSVPFALLLDGITAAESLAVTGESKTPAAANSAMHREAHTAIAT